MDERIIGETKYSKRSTAAVWLKNSFELRNATPLIQPMIITIRIIKFYYRNYLITSILSTNPENILRYLKQIPLRNADVKFHTVWNWTTNLLTLVNLTFTVHVPALIYRTKIKRWMRQMSIFPHKDIFLNSFTIFVATAILRQIIICKL